MSENLVKFFRQILKIFGEKTHVAKTKKNEIAKSSKQSSKKQIQRVPSLPKRTKRFLKNENRGVKNNV